MPAGGALRLTVATASAEQPASFRGAFPSPTPSLRACALACLAALLSLAAWGWLQSGRGLWQDEAILLANLGLPWTTYFHPLPFYDQAAPPFALLVLDGAYRLAGGSVLGIRLVLLAVHLTILCGLAGNALRRSDRQALVAIAVVAVTPYIVHFSLELKQYMFEIQASLTFLLALRWHPERPIAVMLLAALLSFFSFSIMLVVGIAVLEALVSRFRGTLQRRWFGLLVVYTAFWLASYLLLFRPAVALQTANYPTAYQRPPLSAYLHDPALLGQLVRAVIPAQPYLSAAGALVALVAVLLVRRPAARSTRAETDDPWQPARVLGGLLVLVALLWLARLYPISSMKQFAFTLPVTALLLANGIVAACAGLASGTVTALILAAMLAPNLAYTAAKQWRRSFDFQDTHGLYAFVRANRSALIVPDLMFEPTLRAYSARDPAPPRQVAGWLRAETRPMETPERVVADLAAGNVPIYQHVWQPLEAAQAYPAYLTWVVRHARNTPEALFAAAQFDPKYEPVLVQIARRQGCGIMPAYRSRDVVAYRLTCSPLTPRRASTKSTTTSGSAQITRVL